MQKSPQHGADAHFADAQEAWAGYLLSGLANIDPKFAEWANECDYLLVHDDEHNFTVFVTNGFTAREVIRRYVRTTMPSTEHGGSLLSKRMTDDKACALYADALSELEVDTEQIDAEFALFALAHCTAPPSHAVAALYWDLIWVSLESPLSGELLTAVASEQIHVYFTDPIDAIMQQPETEGMDLDGPTGRIAVYQHAIAERTAVMNTGFSLYQHLPGYDDDFVPDVPETADQLLAAIGFDPEPGGITDDMLDQRNFSPDGAPTGNGLD